MTREAVEEFLVRFRSISVGALIILFSEEGEFCLELDFELT
jgi:hypothetical protein